MRHGLYGDLGFIAEDRFVNIRRIGEMSKLFINADVIALTAFISPFASDHQRVHELVGDGDFIEIYCRCSLETCEDRDVKGMYKKTRRGEISNFTASRRRMISQSKQKLLLILIHMLLTNASISLIAELESRGTFHKHFKNIMDKNTAIVG